jgi:hypothetical protein
VTLEEEIGARSLLKWQRDGDEWVLLYRSRRMERAVPVPLTRVCIGPENLGTLATSRIGPGPRTPRWLRPLGRSPTNLRTTIKMPSKTGVFKKQFRHPCVFPRRPSNGPNETPLKPQTQISVLDRDRSHRPTIGGGLLGVAHVKLEGIRLAK